MDTDVGLNTAQTVFAVFFAIFWGTAANAQPKWKAFAWGQMFEPGTRPRLLLSFAVLNLAPIAFFVFVLHELSANRWVVTAWGLSAGCRIGLAVLPAFGAFGFLRIWTSIVQYLNSMFYPYPDEKVRKLHGIDLSDDDLNPRWAKWNFLGGILYIIVGIAVAWL